MPNSKYKKRDIHTLIALAQENDSKALEELIRRIQRNIFTMFSYLTEKRQDIADLTQEALVKMAKNLKIFPSSSHGLIKSLQIFFMII